VKSPIILLLAVVVWVQPVNALAQAAADLLHRIGPGMVRVEIDLQFDRGEPPVGVMDHDAGSRQVSMHSLADLVTEERPLETTGFLIGPDRVVALDWTVHPRFIKAIHVRTATAGTTAKVVGYGRDQWAVFLKLDGPLPGTQPLEFGKGVPAHIATFYRVEGTVTRELLPFSPRIQQPDDGAVWRVVENQGLAVTTNGTALAVLLGRRLPTNDSWQVHPDSWARVDSADYARRLTELEALADGTLVRVHLSFRSPKTPSGMGMGMGRPRFSMDEDDNDESGGTERDVLGVVLAPDRVAVLTALRPSVTARLQRIQIHAANGPGVPARFIASLKDLGALVVEPEQPLTHSLKVAEPSVASFIERLCYRIDLQLQGESQLRFLHHSRIGSVRVGQRLEAYPELADMSDSARAYLFTPDFELIALPMSRRDRGTARPNRFRSSLELTPARLLARAVAGLPAGADPANIPVSEADENQLAWLGAELQPMTRELARANGVSDQTRDGTTGAMVTYVHPASPAARAGIMPGAILLRLQVPGEALPVEVELDDDPMRSQPFPWDRLDEVREQFFDRLPTPWSPSENSFTRALTDLGFGREFTLELSEDGKMRNIQLKVEAGPAHYESAPRHKAESIGLTVRDLTYDVRRYKQRKEDEPGVVISKVEAGGRASVAGIKPFEVISHVNDQPVLNVKDFEAAISAGGELRLSVKRMAKGRIVTISAN
jgi:serine protease Do